MAIASYGGRPSLWFRLSSSGRYVIAPNSRLAPTGALFAASQMLLPRQREAALLEHPPAGPVKQRINAMRLPAFTFQDPEAEKHSGAGSGDQLVPVQDDRTEVPNSGETLLVVEELEVGPVKFPR